MKQLHVFTVFTTPESFFDGQFKYLVDQGYEVVLVSSDGPGSSDFARRNNIRFLPVKMPRALSPMAIMKAIISISIIIKRETPDVVFGHTPVGALCAMIASCVCGVKKRVYYRHGLIYTTMKGVKRAIFRLEEKFVAGLATHVINVSPSLSKLAVRDRLNGEYKNNIIGHGTCGGVDAVKLFNPNDIDNSKRQELVDQYNLAGADIVFGFCGRICKDKGNVELIDAFRLFQSRHKELNSKLILIGHFDERDIMPVETVTEIENNPDIIVTEMIEPRIIPVFYTLLDVFVFPSHREGFGMTVVEASAMELPILVSRSHGCVDSIVEHVTGEYIELTAKSICLGMEQMMDRKKRLELGQNGRKMVLSWFDHQVMWPMIKELYKKILQ